MFHTQHTCIVEMTIHFLDKFHPAALFVRMLWHEHKPVKYFPDIYNGRENYNRYKCTMLEQRSKWFLYNDHNAVVQKFELASDCGYDGQQNDVQG